MNTFAITYAVVWVALALYVARQEMIQRKLTRVVDDLRRDKDLSRH